MADTDLIECSCLEVFGEDPDCPLHGIDALEARLAEKDAQYERLAGRMDAMAADNQRLRAECEGLRAALLRAMPYVDCAVHDDGGIDHCDIAYRMDLEAIEAALASLSQPAKGEREGGGE